MSHKINHFIDAQGQPFVFDLNNSSLPAWNYSISSNTGEGMSMSVVSLTCEEIYQRKLAQENELFDHFISTGEIKK